MAATNFTPIQLYFSTTASAVPLAANLAQGELAINITDGKLYYEDNTGAVQVIATKGAGTIGGSTTQIQYNNAGALAGNAAMVFNSGTSTTTLTTLNLTNALGAIYGGTAQSTYTQGDFLYASATNTLAKLGIGANTYILTSTGSVPQWVAPSSIAVLTATNLAGGLAGSVPYQSALDTTTFLAIGAANRVMTSTGSAPQWVTSLTGLTGVSSSSITNTSLTSGRVVVSTTAGLQADDADLTFDGTTLSAGGFSTVGLSTLVKTVKIGDSSFNGVAVFAAATPAKLYMGTGTVTDVTSAISATNAIGAIASLGITPIAATNTSVTYTNAATLYIAGAPSAGTNVTLTNPYALYVAAGDAYFGGTVTAGTVNLTTLDLTNLEVTNIKAKDGTASITLADTTGIATFSGATVFTAGTALLPAITTTGDTNTGIWFPAADTIAFTEGGAESMRITSAGSVAIGTTTAISTLTVNGTDGITMQRSTANAFAPVLDYLKSRGTTASPAGVSDGDGLFLLRAAPYQGSAFTYLNAMTIEVDGAYTSGQNPPTRQVFYTNVANGSATERLGIKSTELVVNDVSSDYDFRVESDANTHMLFVDSGSNAIGINDSSPTALLQLGMAGSANITDTVQTKVTDFGAANRFGTTGLTSNNDGVYFGMGVENGIPAGLGFLRENAGWNTQIRFYVNNITSGPDSTAAMQERMRIASDGIVINEQGYDLDFRVESDGNANMLFVDAGNNRVVIGAQQWGVATTPLQVNNIAITDSGSAHHILIGNQDSGGTNAPSMIRGVNGALHLGWGDSWTSATGGTMTQAFTVDKNSTSVVVNEDSADIDFRVESDGNTHALFVDAGNSYVGILSDTIDATHGTRAVQIGSATGVNTVLTISAGVDNTNDRYATLVLRNTGNGGATNRLIYGVNDATPSSGNIFNIMYENPGTGTATTQAKFTSTEIVLNDDSLDQDFRVESDANTHALFVDAGLGTVCINGTGASANTDIAGFQNLSSNAVLSGGTANAVISLSRTQNVAASNNATTDAFRFLDHNSVLFGTGLLSGSFYINVSGASGANQFAAIYNVLSTGNGTVDSVFTLETSVTRGTSPVSSIALVNDGSGGAVKVQITYINNSGVVTGGSSTITFVGQISTT